MTTVARDIRLSVIGETKKYQAAMAEIPGVTQKQAAAAAVRFEREMSKAQAEAAKLAMQAARESAEAWKEVGDTLKSALGAAALYEAGKSVLEFAGGVFEARTELLNFEKATSLSTDTLAALQAASERNGVNFEEIIGSVEDFGERLFDFSNGAGGAKEAFELLGFTADEAKKRYTDIDGVFKDVIDRMSRMEDGALRVTVAQQLFSDGGNRLNAIFGDNTLDDYVALAEQYGLVLDQSAVAQTEAWNAAMADLHGTMRLATVELVDFLGLDARVRDFTAGLIFIREVGAATFDAIIERAGALGDIFAHLFEGEYRKAADATAEFAAGAFTTWAGIGDRALDAVADFQAVSGAIEGSLGAVDRQSHKVGQLSDVLKKQQQDAAKAAREHAAALREQEQQLQKVATAGEKLADISLDATSDILSGEEEIQRAYDARIEAILEAALVGGNLDAANAAAQEAEARRIRDLATLETERYFERLALEQDLTAKLQEAEELRREAVLETGRIADKVYGNLSGAVGELLSISERAAADEARAVQGSLDQQLTQREQLAASLEEAATVAEAAEIQRQIDRLDREIATNKVLLDAERDKINRQFEVRQGLEASGALISGFAGAAAALAPPPIGAGPILGPILAASTIALAGAQAAAIAAESPPQFDAGFAPFTAGPDNYLATLRQGEGVTNQAATDALGGPAAVRRMNETSGAMGGRGPTVIPLVIGGRELGRAVVDELATGRELTQTVRRWTDRRAGVRPVYRVR